MTRRRIEQLVKTWQRRLKLDHWDVEVDWTKPPSEGAFATCWRFNQYDRANLYIDPGFGSWSESFAERTIVHELLHLIARDLDRAIADVESFLAPESYMALDKRYEHEIEGVVDRLATILVEVSR